MVSVLHHYQGLIFQHVRRLSISPWTDETFRPAFGLYVSVPRSAWYFARTDTAVVSAEIAFELVTLHQG